MTATITPEDFRGILAPGLRRPALLAGHATITIANPATGNRFTYRIKKADQVPNGFLVFVLTGANNESDYRYIGILRQNANDTLSFGLTRKSAFGADAPSVKAFFFFAAHVDDFRLEVWHEGRCCRCGRKLTVPESIATGIGPVCLEAAA